MKTFISVALITSAALLTIPQQAAERIITGNRATENIPPLDKAELDRARQYSNIRSSSNLSWTHDGKAILVSTRFGSTRQLHLVESPLGARKQLTFYSEPVTSGEFSPIKNEILFSRDSGGDENYQVFKLDMDTGLTTQLTIDGRRNSGHLWSHDGTKFAYMSNREDMSRFDIWVGSTSDAADAKKIVTGTGFYWIPIAWSHDQRKLLVKQVVSAVDSRPFVVDIATGKMDRLGPADVIASYGGFSKAVFSKDDKGIYIQSDLGTEFTQLRYFDLSSGEMTNLTADIPWNVASIDLAPNGKQLAFTTNEDGISKLYLLNTRSGKYKQMRNIPTGVISNIRFSPDSKQISLTLNRATAAADVYVYNLSKSALTRWTESEIGGLNAERFVESELIHYPTFDSKDGAPRQIPAFVYKPKKVNGKLPVMISIHGGPEGQVRPYFSSRTQYLVNELGTIVITPNVRGSSGYGKTYLGLDNGLKREASVKDIGALIDWIETQPDMDASRIGVIGGSYGGYMVLASMTHYNDKIRAGINFFGVSNFVTFLENTSDYRRDHRRQEYGDERIPEMRAFLNKTAPMNNVSKISKPLFVLQGANDPRVPASESEQIVSRVRANGAEVWYVLFDDEGHGFRKKPNQDFSNAAIGAFLKKHL